MYSGWDHLTVGFPHSDIHGSKPALGSPWLFAECHVLHRLSVPRHPRNALLTLDRAQSGTSPSCYAKTSANVFYGICHADRQTTIRMTYPDQEKPIHNDKEPTPLTGSAFDFSTARKYPLSMMIASRQGRVASTAPPGNGGASRDRTDDLKLAKLALSQLSYGPVLVTIPKRNGGPGRI